MAILERASKRTLIDYQEVVNLQTESKVICINLGVLTILRQLVRQRGLWPSTYYKTLLEGDLYVPPSDVEFDLIDSLVSSFLEESDMTTCNELSEALESLVSLISSGAGAGAGGCGCGSGGAGGTEAPPSPEEPGPPGEQIGDPPPGFDDWAEYEAYKCAVATHIVERLEIDLAWMETANIVAFTALTLGAALLTPIPFDDIAGALAFAIALTVQGVYTTAVQDMMAAVNADFDDFVCALYQAGDAEQAKSNWIAQVDVSIDAQTAAFYAPIEKVILEYMVGYDAINDLFTQNVALGNMIDPGLCDCGSCPQGWTFGSGDIDAGGTFTSGPLADEHRIEFVIGYQQQVIITAITGWRRAPGTPTNNWRITSTLAADCSAPFGYDVLYQPDPPALPFPIDCAEHASIRSADPFTIEWVVVGPGTGCP